MRINVIVGTTREQILWYIDMILARVESHEISHFINNKTQIYLELKDGNQYFGTLSSNQKMIGVRMNKAYVHESVDDVFVNIVIKPFLIEPIEEIDWFE